MDRVLSKYSIAGLKIVFDDNGNTIIYRDIHSLEVFLRVFILSSSDALCSFPEKN